MHKKVKKVLVLTAGIIFLILGLLGLVLPVLQGILFLLIGLFLVSLYFPKIYSWTEKHTARYPHLSDKIKKVENWIREFIGEI